jgi:hypothetical protein
MTRNVSLADALREYQQRRLQSTFAGRCATLVKLFAVGIDEHDAQCVGLYERSQCSSALAAGQVKRQVTPEGA